MKKAGLLLTSAFLSNEIRKLDLTQPNLSVDVFPKSLFNVRVLLISRAIRSTNRSIENLNICNIKFKN